MNFNAISVAAITLVILIIAATGCIEPPKVGGPTVPTVAAAKTPGGIYNPLNPTPAPTAQSFVTIVTPFETTASVQTVTTQGYTVFPIPSPVPEDLTCLIYTKTGIYSYNNTAFTFDLKNPPMYIEYSVTPKYVSGKKVVPGRNDDKTGAPLMVSYTDYSPDSWFLVTVRNKTTGNILHRNGFGPAIGYSRDITGTLKVLDDDNILVELSGNQVTGTAKIWVKPLGNFQNLTNVGFTACKYWTVPQNFLT